MKHLKKYNETRQDIEQLDFEYIKSCFIEFIDKGALFDANEGVMEDDTFDICNIYIKEICKPINIAKKGSIMGPSGTVNIKNSIKEVEERLENLLDIENSIEKIRLKYSDNVYEINVIAMEDNSIRIKIIADDFNNN
jgi:hypothetical protein